VSRFALALLLTSPTPCAFGATLLAAKSGQTLDAFRAHAGYVIAVVASRRTFLLAVLSEQTLGTFYNHVINFLNCRLRLTVLAFVAVESDFADATARLLIAGTVIRAFALLIAIISPSLAALASTIDTCTSFVHLSIQSLH
jgi:hypothetical protein